MSSESKVGGLPEATVSANEIAVMRKHVGQWVPTSNIVDAILEMKELTAVAALSAHGENASVPQPVVDEAMVERACAKFYGSDWLRDADEGFNPKVNDLARSEMRDVLEAAINGEVPC